MDNGKTENRLFWYIENFSYVINGGLVWSPMFSTHGLQNTEWLIFIHPNYETQSVFSLYLWRRDNVGPESILLKFQLLVFRVDGSSLYSVEKEHRFTKKSINRLGSFSKDLYALKHSSEDILCVRCRMWAGEGSVCNVWQSTARTRIPIKSIRFFHKVPNFSALKLNEEKTISIPSDLTQENVYSSTLCVKEIHPGKDSITICNSHLPCIKKISLIDANRIMNAIFEFDSRFSDKKIDEEEHKLYKTFTRQFILNNRKQYLLNDELSLVCEYVFKTPRKENKIEEHLHEIPMMEGNNPGYFDPLGKNETFSSDNIPSSTNPITNRYQMTANKFQHKKQHSAAEKLSNCARALGDLKSLYIEGHLTDVVLKTATKSFPAHKVVLCARSSVFRAMLSIDMREKNTDCIQVDDLSDETVQQLLLFLYSDNVEELQWESAMSLYNAGKNYDIKKLKLLCAFFLAENVSASSASDLLLFADTHSDSDLKELVEDFIFEHDTEVFTSDGWDKLCEENSSLTYKTMQLKFKREKGGK